MTTILDGQLSALDLLAPVTPPKPVPPMFTANINAWQQGGCGWCNRKTVIGGGAREHPRHPEQSIYYEYCEKCLRLYGDPKFWDPEFRFQLNRDMTNMIQREPGLEARLAGGWNPTNPKVTP